MFFSQSAKAMNGWGQVPTSIKCQSIENPLQKQRIAAGTMGHRPEDTLRNKTSWHLRLLLAALAGFLRLTPSCRPVNWI
jgi:hypothetical protein